MHKIIDSHTALKLNLISVFLGPERVNRWLGQEKAASRVVKGGCGWKLPG
jgi:hypothetical protein